MLVNCAPDMKIRDRAMSYAVQTAELGEDPMKILARAQLYAEFILTSLSGATGDGGNIVVQADKLPFNPL